MSQRNGPLGVRQPLVPSIKVRLQWCGAVLQYLCTFAVFILEKKKSNFQSIFLRWIISVIHGGKFTKFGTHLIEGHLKGTVSQICDLGLSFYLMMSRKLSCKNW